MNKKINKQSLIKEILERAVSEVINKDDLEKLLQGKKKLRVKLGIDPTSPNLHLGRSVVLWKLRAFQDLGHQVVFIIGDFTGVIGDTSDKDAERPMLDQKTIKENLKTYLSQAYKILDKSKTEFHYNSKWLKKLGFAEIGFLANQFGLHEFSVRENIKKRLDAGKRVSLRELLYPLMQGYDSVAVKSDVELGGTDQRFNLLAGRVLQEAYGQHPQNILMTEILEGTDGRKMSSSWGNTINLTDSPKDMFGKAMSLPDNLTEKYLQFATNYSLEEIEKLLKDNSHPRDQKIILASKLVEQYHGAKQALQAREQFIAQFSNKEIPNDIPKVKIKPGKYDIIELLVMVKLVDSKNEAKRLFDQGGIKVNQQKIESKDIVVNLKETIILQAGKRKFVKLN